MAPVGPLPESHSPTRMPRKWARKTERFCCLGVQYFPLVFVYSITTWAVWVEATIGFLPVDGNFFGATTSVVGIILYLLLNWSYTTAVFTSPGTTTKSDNRYSSLPTHAPPAATHFTVKSNGELRFCKKCQARKPDRAHHCSTCKTCVLKMDHHCPWLATCVGLHNYKAFLLFLIYTTLFCLLSFAVSGAWVWREILSEGEYTESLMPVNYVMLAVVAGIIGLVLTGFTGWHILLASRGQTTIECLEKTRYLSPLRKSMQQQHYIENGGNVPRSYGQQLQEIHAAPMSADTAPTEALPSHGEQRFQSYDALERFRARERYEEYLDEQDSEKLPSAFDLGWRKNLLHLFGKNKWLWAVPICNTTGDGWSWEASPKWLEARETIAREREAQNQREMAAGWGAEHPPQPPAYRQELGAGKHYATSTRSLSKADRVLGRNPGDYSDNGGRGPNAVSMTALHSRSSGFEEDDYEASSDEDRAERRALDRKAAGGWPHKVGVVTNTLLGNTLARQKDDKANSRGWDGHDDSID